MGRSRSTKTEERHKEVLKKYNEVIREKGEDAPYITKSRIAEIVAERTHYSTYNVMRIIHNSLKCKLI